MVADQGYGLIDVVTATDFAYVVAVIEDKKGVWKEAREGSRCTIMNEKDGRTSSGARFDESCCGWLGRCTSGLDPK